MCFMPANPMQTHSQGRLVITSAFAYNLRLMAQYMLNIQSIPAYRTNNNEP